VHESRPFKVAELLAAWPMPLDPASSGDRERKEAVRLRGPAARRPIVSTPGVLAVALGFA
jgi:hypothetical protein